uniref:A kinase-anchoring proteins AKAP-5 and AKAP-12 calmodulin (CaM)-binding domain-containing protein n=1 Tax=Eptatretus burgeri TaxID=7764 RepID=A0A8C4QQ32_EPTBU
MSGECIWQFGLCVCLPCTCGQRNSHLGVAEEIVAEAVAAATVEHVAELEGNGDSVDAASKPASLPRDVGFKKVFKFGGFKFAMKKDGEEKVEPVKLINVKGDIEAPAAASASAVAEESPATDMTNGEHEAAQPLVKEDVTEQENGVKEEGISNGVGIEEVTLPSNQVRSPLKKIFNNKLFSGLRKKQSQEDKKIEQDKEPEDEGTSDEAVETKESAEIVVQQADVGAVTNVQGVVESNLNAESIATNECTTPEQVLCLNTEVQSKPTEMLDVPTIVDNSKAKGEPLQEEETAEMLPKVSKSVEGPCHEAEISKSNETVLSSEKSPGSPLRKLLKGGPLKYISGKKGKDKVEDEVEGSADKQSEVQNDAKNDQGVTSGDVAESVEPATPECVEAVVEHESQIAKPEKKREGITAWSSFKKLVAPKRLAKKNSESDKEEEQPAVAVKTETMSSTESSSSVGKDETSKATGEEQAKEDSGKKKSDAGVPWEALICIGSAKKRGRRSSDSEEEQSAAVAESVHAPAESVEAANDADEKVEPASVEEHQINVEGSPETQVDMESETEVSDVPVTAAIWGSLKRFVSPKWAKTKGEENVQAAQPEVIEEQASKTSTLESIKEQDGGVEVQNQAGDGSKAEVGTLSSWSFRKLLPGKKKKRSKADSHEENPDALVSREVKSDESDSDTPAVVPLAEYEENTEKVCGDTSSEMKDEGLEKELQRLAAEVAVQALEVKVNDETPAEEEFVENGTSGCVEGSASGNEYIEGASAMLEKAVQGHCESVNVSMQTVSKKQSEVAEAVSVEVVKFSTTTIGSVVHQVTKTVTSSGTLENSQPPGECPKSSEEQQIVLDLSQNKTSTESASATTSVILSNCDGAGSETTQLRKPEDVQSECCKVPLDVERVVLQVDVAGAPAVEGNAFSQAEPQVTSSDEVQKEIVDVTAQSIVAAALEAATNVVNEKVNSVQSTSECLEEEVHQPMEKVVVVVKDEDKSVIDEMHLKKVEDAAGLVSRQSDQGPNADVLEAIPEVEISVTGKVHDETQKLSDLAKTPKDAKEKETLTEESDNVLETDSDLGSDASQDGLSDKREGREQLLLLELVDSNASKQSVEAAPTMEDVGETTAAVFLVEAQGIVTEVASCEEQAGDVIEHS